jgi:two-component system, chemotaxis family, sensor kinase CheA
VDDDILNEFVHESREHLATIEADLLTIEGQGANLDEALVNKVFRAAHSIKGGSGFFGLNRVKELAHKTETVLDMLRSRRMAPNAEITNLLLASFDRLREMINNPAESEQAEIAGLATSLTALASSYLPPEQRPLLTGTTTLRPETGGTPVILPQFDLDRARRTGRYVYRVDYDLIHDIDRKGKNVLDLFRSLGKTGEILDCGLDCEAVGTLDEPIGNRLPLRLVFMTVIEPDLVGTLMGVERERIAVLFDPDKVSAASVSPSPAFEIYETDRAPADTAGPFPTKDESPMPVPAGDGGVPEAADSARKLSSPLAGGPPAVVEETIRINVGLLESLMNLAGELVLSRNQLRAAIAKKDTRALSVADQRLTQITSELQDAIMQTRLQPIGNVFGKFPRLVRDLAAAQHKEILLDVQGKEVALDKSLIEGLSDPLTHMIRNAADHGVESPEERSRVGKKRQGTIRIEARHEAGQVVVEIADDGRGIDPERIGRSAVTKGLISAEKVQGMSSQDKTALLFLPGLSTAERVTDISGRGVGMDVVKTNLDRLGGKVEILSEIGKGTRFRIKLPLTLAIIPSLIVSVNGERFAVPQINVEELLRIRPEDAKTRIEVIGSTEVLLLRDRLIPLVRFVDLLGILPSYGDPATGHPELDRRGRLADRRSPSHPIESVSDDSTPTVPADPAVGSANRRETGDRRRRRSGSLEIAVLTTGTLTYGLVVGAFHDTEEIVVKPLGRHLKGLSEYAGATTLGDGAVALILDVAGLAAKAGMTSVSGTTRAREQAETAERERLIDTHALLLFHNAPDELFATPLDSVRRIERIKPAQVEMAVGRRTLRYREASLPLVTLADVAQVRPMGDVRELAVIVTSVRGREVGLLGAMPVDVIETRATIDQSTHRQKGVAGSVLVQERTALLADVVELVDAVYPEWAVEHASALAAGGTRRPGVVLLAEDSEFFRGQVTRFLEEEGFTVLAAEDGEGAWELLLQHLDEVQAVVTDIEMPRLNGLDLTKRIRADTRTTKLPVIAVTSLAGEDQVAQGKAAGVDDYQIKLDRDGLLARLREIMHR